MLSSQEEQAERRRVLANDQRVKEQSGTFLSHTHMDEGGRFGQVASAQIVGADPIPRYPAAAAHQRDPCGPEQPFGYSVNDLDPGPVSPAQDTGDLTSDAPPATGMSTGEQRGVSSPPFRRIK
jgi:hypothetical protein